MKELWEKMKKGLCKLLWHPENYQRCTFDLAQFCRQDRCPSFSEKEILLVISDIEGNQLKTNCKRLALQGAHIEALKIFGQNVIREEWKRLMRENENLKREQKFT